MAVNLNLDQDNNVPIQQLIYLPHHFHKEIKRRIWWICYFFECLMTSRMKLKSWIRNSEMSVPLPCDENIWMDQHHESDRDKEVTEIAIMSSEGNYQGGLTFENWNTGFLVIVYYHPFKSIPIL